MILVLMYASCAIAASVILLQWRTLGQIVANTKRLQAIFPWRLLRHITDDVQNDAPLTLPLGSRLPACRALRLNFTSGPDSQGTIDGSLLIGKSTVILFCHSSQLENWDTKVIMAVLRGCWMKVDGPVYLCLPSGDNVDLNCAAIRTLRSSSIAKDVVLVLDQRRSFWTACGISKTPCVIQLNRAGALAKYGLITVSDGPLRDGGGADA